MEEQLSIQLYLISLLLLPKLKLLTNLFSQLLFIKIYPNQNQIFIDFFQNLKGSCSALILSYSTRILFGLIINKKIQMGAMQCCSQSQQPDRNTKLQYKFGEDQYQDNIPHPDNLGARNESVNIFLKDCQQRLKQSLKLYKDPTFKSQSLILKSSNQQQEFKCVFYRPYHFLKDKYIHKKRSYKIFQLEEDSSSSKIIIKNDVLQYFGVFLCFLADNSHLIKNLILTDENSYGIQVINMYANGHRIPVYIDDYILCHQQMPVFSQPVNNIYMWPCLLEKAWLKLKGYGSKNISITSPFQVFQHFLLYPFEDYNLNTIGDLEFQAIRTKIQTIRKNDCCIVSSKKYPLHKIGLSGRKHYYLNSIFQFQGRFYYYLRNPCGNFDFRGINRTLPQQLFQKIKKLRRQIKIVQGNFVLEQGQFLEQIEQLLIVRYKTSSNIVSDQFVNLREDEELYAQIKLPKNEEVSISFLQGERQEYSPITYQILHYDEGHFQMISGLKNEEGYFGFRLTNLLDGVYQQLSRGSYLLRIKKKSSSLSNKPTQDKIIVTASQQIQINTALGKDYKRKFQQFLKEKGMQQLRNEQNENRQKDHLIEYTSVWFEDLVYIYVQKVNKSNSRINLQVNFPQKMNLQCTNYNLSSQFVMIPLIEDDLLIIFERINLTQKTRLGKYSIETF